MYTIHKGDGRSVKDKNDNNMVLRPGRYYACKNNRYYRLREVVSNLPRLEDDLVREAKEYLKSKGIDLLQENGIPCIRKHNLTTTLVGKLD